MAHLLSLHPESADCVKNVRARLDDPQFSFRGAMDLGTLLHKMVGEPLVHEKVARAAGQIDRMVEQPPLCDTPPEKKTARSILRW